MGPKDPQQERWWRYARDDLVTARFLLSGRLARQASFHAQQAAEKALKALLISETGISPPRTHDLVRLAELVAAPDAIRQDLDVLSVAYTMARYPDAVPEEDASSAVEQESATQHVAVAERALSWVEQQLRTR